MNDSSWVMQLQYFIHPFAATQSCMFLHKRRSMHARRTGTLDLGPFVDLA